MHNIIEYISDNNNKYTLTIKNHELTNLETISFDLVSGGRSSICTNLPVEYAYEIADALIQAAEAQEKFKEKGKEKKQETGKVSRNYKAMTDEKLRRCFIQLRYNINDDEGGRPLTTCASWAKDKNESIKDHFLVVERLMTERGVRE
jgi:hypothetical protein